MKYIRLVGLMVCLLSMALPISAQTVPCTGPTYTTDATYFRAAASGQSSDATASKKKALSAVRTVLSEQIQAKVQVALASQNRFGETERTAFLRLVQQTILQEGTHLKVICEESQKKGNRYQTTLVVELLKAQFWSTLQEQLSHEKELKSNFEADKFKAAF